MQLPPPTIDLVSRENIIQPLIYSSDSPERPVGCRRSWPRAAIRKVHRVQQPLDISWPFVNNLP